MKSFIIEGGHPLSGTIAPQGAKNEALEVISATLLTPDEVTIDNIPDILDVKNLILLLKDMGVEVEKVSRNEKKYSWKSYIGNWNMFIYGRTWLCSYQIFR